MATVGTKHAMPRPGTRTRRVWDISDAITRETGRRAQRREVIERYVAEGGNPNTGNTQYQYWKTDYDGRHLEYDPVDTFADVGAQPLKIAPDGRVVIPSQMRTAMELGEDGHVTARVVNGELRLVSRSTAIKRLRKETQARNRSGESVVEEFLAERRAMWNDA